MTSPCTTCDTYLAVRRPVLLRPLGRAVSRTGFPPAGLLAAYMSRVHARHVSGKPILTTQPTVDRPVSPSTIAAKKRVA